MRKKLSATLAAILIFSCCAALCIGVSASDIITHKITYGSSGAAYLRLTKRDDANTIYYTANGKAPSEKSDIYTKKLKTSSSCVIRATELDPSGNKVASIKLTLQAKASPVTYKKTEEEDGCTVKLFCETENAEIRYTVDGSKPTEDSDRYIMPLKITQSCVIRAAAFRDDLRRGRIASVSVKLDEGVSYSTEAVVSESFPEYMTAMLEMINKERADAGVEPLVLDAELCEAAAVRGDEIVRSYSHTRPDGRTSSTIFEDLGFMPGEYKAYGKISRATGENIARGQDTVARVVREWLASESHRNTIVFSKYKKVGFAYAKGNDEYEFYWVQIFAS